MKILIVKLSSLGDILHLFPAVSDLRRKYPAAQIHWLVEPAFAEAVAWHSAVDRVIQAPLRAHKKTWWKLPALLAGLRKQLRAENYDVVLDAQGLLKSAVLARLAGNIVAGFAAGSAREPLASRLYQKTAAVEQGLHVIEKNRRLAAALFSTDIKQPADYGLQEFRSGQLHADVPASIKHLKEQGYVVLLHGTTWSSKFWPEPCWAELIGLLAQRGWHSLLPWGNQQERQRAERLQATNSAYAQVLPRLSLTQLMNALLHARCFVSVESGIGHLAAALDVPGVMLHGPTDPGYSGILDKACTHITSGIYCSPCFKRDCPRIHNKKEIPPCQQQIVPLQVLRQCLPLLA